MLHQCVAAIKSVGVHTGDRVQRNAREGLRFWRTWMRSIYLPDEVNLYMDSFIRVVFCLYYVPSIVVVLAVTHSALERLVWVLVVPVTQEMERNPYHFSSLQTLSAGLYSIAVKVAPFAALGISIATVGHKAMNCFVEALMDAYTTNNDKDYPLLHARLQFVLEKRSRTYMFVGVMVTLGASLAYVFQQQTIALLSRDEPHVLLAAAVIAVTQGLFIFVTVAHGVPEDVIEDLTDSAAGLLSALGSPRKSSFRLGKQRKTGEAPGGTAAMAGADPLPHAHGSGTTPFWEYGEHPLSEHASALAPQGGRAGGQHRADSTRRQQTPLDRQGSPAFDLNSPDSTASSEVPSPFDPPDVASSVVRFLTYFLGDWWTHNIHYMRHIGFTMALIFGLLVMMGGGPLQGVTSAVLLIMCLNFPHLFGYVSLMVTFAVIRTVRSFSWLQRHHDMFLPVLIVDMPYQLVLLNALHYFRHHPATCALLLGVNVLLVARAIDLVWEYDMSESGSVHWEDAARECACSRQKDTKAGTLEAATASTPLSEPGGGRGAGGGGEDDSMAASGTSTPGGGDSSTMTLQQVLAATKRNHGRGHSSNSTNDDMGNRNGDATWASGLVKPSLAIVLEDAYEKRHRRPGLVSLDMAMDLKHMRIRYTDKKKSGVALRRHQIIPSGAGRRYLRDHGFYSYVLPRLLSLQSPGYFAGAQYRKARVLLRGISITALLMFTLIVFGMIVQAAFPQLRSFPVRVTVPGDQSFLSIDHVVVRMHLLSAKKKMDVDVAVPAAEQSEIPVGTVPDAADVVFQWSNVTSPAGEDFYPRLCRRDYYGTSVWELSLLALAPYLFNLDEIGTLLEFMNGHLGSDWVIKQRHGTSCVATDSAHTPTKWGGFYDFYSAKRDMSVVAVRGTDLFSFTDFLIDINLFFEPVMYQIMTFMVPGAIVVPKALVVNLIQTVSLRGEDEAEEEVGEALRTRTWAALVESGNSSLRRCQQNNYRRDFYADVQNHLTYVATQPEGRPRHVVLTGHSLGGAVAAIVGAQMELEVVAFSAPGIALARKKFNVDLRSIHKHVMTVVSTNDIVPALGEQGGEVHHVECLAAKREMCHAIEFMVGSLWRACSSVRDRFPAIADLV